MEILGNVLDIAQTIYGLCDQASSNKRQCSRLRKRIEILLVAATKIKKQPEKSSELKVVLRELQLTLRNAKSWVLKYSNQGWWMKILKANCIKEEFDLINDRLKDAADDISVLLAIEHRESFLKFFDENKRLKQSQKDIEEDMSELKERLNSGVGSLTKDISHVAETVEDTNSGVKNILNQVEEIKSLLSSGTRTPRLCTEIKSEDLIWGALVMEKPNFDLYRGQYYKSPVAIKVLKGQPLENVEKIREIFNLEIKTMKKYECVNIIRVFGICIDKAKSEPYYCMVTEFCEKGTLRELLSREKNLPWNRRIHMTLDAARALYRLHQTETKPMLHGSLSSSKFLVDGTYCLKLSGFELSKTESSMRRQPNVEKQKQNIEWSYIAPETMQNINAYDKHSEIYSLGIVFYEIATGRIPIQGLSGTNPNDMYQNLSKDMKEGLPADCPSVLSDLIVQSTGTNPTERPSAGVIVDLLMDYLNQQEASEAAALIGNMGFTEEN
ncbi:mixed lineage kinase domain-like protein [Xenopus laevis]|uniref:Protein kinase domain-containing protein n=2 Tax=Xenopus laevis TaxID=8355 RepID=A0A974D2Y6_XENLA|nr:mixed lineage kinase domain-like protein [Xenopus laevis]OCT84654.1 hypothetical protein XELAEV_18022808mg [Xenopus laevis]